MYRIIFVSEYDARCNLWKYWIIMDREGIFTYEKNKHGTGNKHCKRRK